MGISRQGAQRAMTRLLRAQPARPPLELDARWQADLMQEILAKAAGDAVGLAVRWRAHAAGLMLRFAGAGACLAAALLLYVMIFGPDIDTQAAALILDNPAVDPAAGGQSWS
ncbi:16S rRNA-processing protein RimM [Desulfarculus baarsii DSM 2075]|uniref:16S rRNA-processing protein RimM n=1 Tax=Desulfarculus baarsii (strain ATCC 33931 / DSM 2075 / LMG 7858 / VKM B-1802 / 2st14) TaxID=644282 RepID=E1QLH6_DESB2|nr:hypothetical protein [Desulfarculus baarsii]ADK86411.1 16S rRNA-processing protein RimM [Desulfarculus baarsii DSM 2075]